MTWLFVVLAVLCALAAPFLAGAYGVKVGLLMLALWVAFAAAAVVRYTEEGLKLGIGLVAVVGISATLTSQVVSIAKRRRS